MVWKCPSTSRHLVVMSAVPPVQAVVAAAADDIEGAAAAAASTLSPADLDKVRCWERRGGVEGWGSRGCCLDEGRLCITEEDVALQRTTSTYKP